MNALDNSTETSADNAASSLGADASRVIELVGFLVQGLVAHPEEVEVEQFVDSAGVIYGVRVHPSDLGRVIGREGRVINALRNLAKASATKIGKHVSIEVLTADE